MRIRNNPRQVVESAAQATLSAAMIPVFIAFGDIVPSWLRIAGIASCACLFLLSVSRMREAIDTGRFVSHLRKGVEEIVAGNYAMRFHTGYCAAMDEIIFAVNRLTDLLEKARADSIRSEASRKSLLSDISHDIRTPLTSIIGYIGALKDDIASDSDERDEYVEILESKSRALKSMVEDIFQLAKLDADEIPMNPERLDLAELVREIVIEFLPQIHSAEIALVTDIPDEPIPVVADRTSVARIVRNLVQNALQHGTDDRFLRVAVSREEHPSISVTDRGRGIPAEDIHRVFGRLYRRDAARSSASGGSGLGLAIARSLALKNGAFVDVTSVPGGETVFKVDFNAMKGDLRKN